MKEHRVTFLPSGTQGFVPDGTPLRSAALALGEGIETICGEKALCGKCRVRILEGSFPEHSIESSPGHLSPPAQVETKYAARWGFKPGERLACQARVQGDLVVFVPAENRASQQIVRKAASQRPIRMNPAIRKYTLELSAPTLYDLTADWERVSAELEARFGLRDLSIDHRALQELSAALRQGNWSVSVAVWEDHRVIRVEPGRSEKAYGLAVDVGTTTIAVYLCDLTCGELLATEAMMNPQVRFGEDVMTRISYTQAHQQGLHELNQAIIRALNQLARSAALQAGIAPEDILEAVLVGNTVMHHVLLSLDILPLGLVPFAPSIYHSYDLPARELGLAIHPAANVHLLPVEAGFVGADNMAVILAEEPYHQDEVVLIIDVGTNGELVLGNRRRLLSASCATGPAFEGACIKFGMRAAGGAIEKVRVDPQTYTVRFSVMGQTGSEPARWNTELQPGDPRARGICGSGIVDAAAELLAAGIIRKNGAFDKSLPIRNLRAGPDGFPEFVIAWANETAIGQDITITQDDVRAIQLAKAAMMAGAQLLLRRFGIERPDKVILAGAFGAVIDKKRALRIGLFPYCGLENVHSVGNAAGDGARIALLDKDKRLEADRVARQVEYVELTTEPGFQEIFLKETNFPLPHEAASDPE